MSVIVKVNQDEITDKMLNQAVTRFFIQLEEDEEIDFQPTKENMKYLKTETLNQIIERVLMLQLAEKTGISIDEKDVLRELAYLKSDYETEKDWSDSLLSLSLTEEEAKIEVKNDLTLHALKRHICGDEMDLSDENLKKYFEDNQEQMKEPDLFSFYELPLNNVEEVNTAAMVINSPADFSEKKEKLAAFDLNLDHYSDLPTGKIPEQIFNVLNDLEEGKIGTMVLDNGNLVLYKLIKRVNGKRFEFKEIKDKLKEYLSAHGQQDIYSKVLNEELEKAEIEYMDVSALEAK